MVLLLVVGGGEVMQKVVLCTTSNHMSIVDTIAIPEQVLAAKQ